MLPKLLKVLSEVLFSNVLLLRRGSLPSEFECKRKGTFSFHSYKDKVFI